MLVKLICLLGGRFVRTLNYLTLVHFVAQLTATVTVTATTAFCILHYLFFSCCCCFPFWTFNVRRNVRDIFSNTSSSLATIQEPSVTAPAPVLEVLLFPEDDAPGSIEL